MAFAVKLFMLPVILALALSFPVCAQEAAKDTFKLSASVAAKSQLSRTEMDKAALGMGSLPQQRPIVRESIIATAPAAPQRELSNEPDSYLQEYNVDWSTWISSLADRWFYMLKGAEALLGVQFNTPRPALIQFTCYADGTMGNFVLKQSSGVPAYDRLQFEALRAAVPVPPFPPGTRRTSITLTQGWESHPKRPGEQDFQPGSFGRGFPQEKVRQWSEAR